MPLQINDSILNFSPKPLDFKYCKFSAGRAVPYNGTADVLSAILPAYRYQGLTVLVTDSGTVKEFWFYGGMADTDLVIKAPSLAKVAYTGSYNDLLDLPPLPPPQVNVDWNATEGITEILNKPSQVSVFTNDAGYLTQVTAANGLSTVGNQVVLGQDIGDPNTLGALITPREIPFNGQSFQFSDPAGTITFSPVDLFFASSPDSGNNFHVDINANYNANISIADFTYGTPSITLNGGLSGGIANNPNSPRMEITATAFGGFTGTSAVYLYPGSEDDSFVPRVYLGNLDPSGRPQASIHRWDDLYQQALVLMNECYDSASFGIPGQGTLAVISQTWDTTAAPTLILGNVHNFFQAGAGAKLIDLQAGGVSKFSVVAQSGNTVIGSSDNGSFFQVQQPEVDDWTFFDGVNISSIWNTSLSPTLIRGNVTPTAYSGNASFLQFSLGGQEIYNAGIYGWSFTPVEGEDLIYFTDGTLGMQTINNDNYQVFLSARESAQLVLADLTGGLPYIQLTAGPGGRYSGFFQLGGEKGDLQFAAGNQQNGLFSMIPSNTSWPTSNFIFTTGGANVLDGGQAVQINQYPVQQEETTGALAVTSTWDTTGEPTLIKGAVTDTASGDNALVMDLEVNNTPVFTVDKQGQITTGDPGSGAAKWKLGKVLDQEGIVLNTQQFIEVTIDGQNYRLALIATTSG